LTEDRLVSFPVSRRIVESEAVYKALLRMYVFLNHHCGMRFFLRGASMFRLFQSSPLVALLALLLLFYTFTAWAAVSVPEVQNVRVWGETAATQDASVDKQRAVAIARRAAVEQVVGSYVTSKTLVENFQVVEDRIYSNAAGFVNNYRILEEQRTDLQRVHIEAQVSVAPVTEILRASGLLREWRVGVLLAPDQKNLSHMLSYYSTPRIMEVTRNIETEIARKLVESGFKVVDPVHLNKLRQQFEKTGDLSDTPLSGMDLLVTGYVSMAARKSGGPMDQAICQIHGKILRVDTGEVVYQGTVGNTFDGVTLLVPRDLAFKYAGSLGNGMLSDGAPDLRSFGGGASAALDKAIRLASAMASDTAVSQITRLPAAVSARIALEIHGLDFSQLLEFEEELKTMENVASVRTEEFSGDAQQMEVEYDGDAMNLARSIGKSKITRNMKLKIKKVTKNKITLSVD